MIKTFTSDHFETYKKCPKAYYYKYKKKIKFALQKDTYKLGRSIHSLADYHLRGLTLGKIEADLDETTKEHWQNVLKSPLLNKKIICTEWGFDILLGKNIWLNGRIDAVFEASEESPNSTNLRLSQMRPQKCENKSVIGQITDLFETGQWRWRGKIPFFPQSHGQNAQMLFVAGDFKVLLLTRHIPLAKVPSMLTQKFIEEEIIKLNSALAKLGLKRPKIALCGLNPHAGEEGLLGKEEQEEFLPALKNLKEKNIDIEGPFPADMLFAKASDFYKKNEPMPYDCYVATYHDQGLCAVKSIDLDKTVNVTIGLDILRTSPAHGTAFDIAGKNIASAQSMKEAIKFAFAKIPVNTK
ncbi:MAG: 4-hydroxythreonine-4-phosphate dehydrogenase PdxA [bacterium]